MAARVVRLAISLVASCVLMTRASWAGDLQYAPAPVDNPLKGFVPYDGINTNFPHSLEYFNLPLAVVQTNFTGFDWRALENKLQAVAGRGHQAVFRFYVDYPNVPSGLPEFLRSVPVRNYDDWGNGTLARSVAPDYENADLRRALTNFVAALGARYDSDPRVGFITVGLLGFWGEWHTYPYNGYDRPTNWFASTAAQREVLDAYATAFHQTPLLLREPKPGVSISSRRLGFHDDSFAYSTLGAASWYFWPMIQSYGLEKIWRTQPIGGEIRPELWDCIWNEPSCTPAGQDFLRCVETTHASWLLDSGTFKGVSGAARDRALAGARRLGYELFVNSVELPQAIFASQPLRVALTVTNTGVAPLYHRWPVRLALRSAQGQISISTNQWDLTQVRPGDAPVRFQADLPSDKLGGGFYTALMSLPNPLPRGQPIRFANETQDATLPGWLTLGSFDIRTGLRLGPPMLRQSRMDVPLEGLRAGSEVEVWYAPLSASTSWQILDRFQATASEAVWSYNFPPGPGACFRLRQPE